MNKITLLIILSFTCILPTPVLADIDPWKESYRLENSFQYQAALNALNKVTSSSELLLLRRGWLNYLKGSNSQSIESYKKALNKNSQSLDARLGIILPLLAQQRWRESALNANKVLQVAPWNYYAHIRLMAAEEALKQWEQLKQHASNVNLRYPSDATVIVYIARANRKLNHKTIAIRWYKKVLELVPENIEAKLYLY
jgi:tetratricopeptide (TPR) repeat protein